jgi:TolB-like protein
MGDGVNIAARLEGIAKPGTICLSEDAYRQVKQRLDLKVTDLGATPLKNIAEPVRVYSLEVGVPSQAKPAAPSNSPPATKAHATRPRWPALTAAVVVLAVSAGAYAWRSGLASRMIGSPAPPHLSIVVLPFANLSSDPEQDYFADAITDDLTTDLSHLTDSFVIARNTAFTYKGKSVDVKQIGRELGVRYALEGSVRRLGEDIAVNAQLISTDHDVDLQLAELGSLALKAVGPDVRAGEVRERRRLSPPGQLSPPATPLRRALSLLLSHCEQRA